jgi:UTP--glucose-1-phosphate uridylyltransferase
MSGVVDKALVPIAGLGTRLRPVSSVVPKAMFPLVDAKGRLRAVIHVILAEVAAAGVDEVGVIVSPGQRESMEAYLAAARAAADAAGEPAELPGRIEYILQPEPEGFGEAVLRGGEFVGAGAEGFLLMLGDHVYLPDAGAPPCAGQVAAAFAERRPAAMVGMQPAPAGELPRVGAAGGEPIGERLYRCTDFVEKPDLATARARLATPGLPEDTFLAHCGIYTFTPEIFDCLAELAAGDRGEGQEVQLADAQAMLLGRHREDYLLWRIAGRAMDTGTPAGYAAAQVAMARARAARGPVPGAHAQ